MSARSMSLDVLVRLRDMLSSPLRGILNQFRRIGDFGRRIGILGAAIAGISFMGPINEAAAFQQKLLDIAGTAELVGAGAFAFVDEAAAKYEGLALKVGQASDTVAAGAGQMIAAGVDLGVIDRNLETIGRSATAANTEFADMAGVATSLLKTLNVPETELEGALAGLVTAGKAGAFELKDMARYFPQLTGQMKKFGIEGRAASDQLAAMLQIAKMGTSDPSIAANNLNNFLSKALAPVTVKNFKGMGVDIEAVMMDATAKGLNPLEAMLQKIGKLTGVSENAISKYMGQAKKRGLEGAEALEFVKQQLEAIGAAGKLGELFGDQQVLDFLIPMMANIEEYKRIRDRVAAATGQVVDKDFETQMAGINRELVTLGEIGTQSVRMVGFAFAEWLPQTNDWLIDALGWVRQLDKNTGGMVKRVLSFAGAGLLVVSALGALGVALPIVGAGLSLIAGLLGLALSPLGIFVGLLAAGGAYVWKNWDRFGPRLMRLWDRMRGGLGDFADTLRNGFRGTRALLSDALSAFRRGDWAGAGRSLARAVATGFSELSTLLGEALRTAYVTLRAVDWSGIGTEMATRLLSGLEGLRERLGIILRGAFAVAAETLAGIDWSAAGQGLGRAAGEWGIAAGKLIVAGLRAELSAASDLGALIATKLLSLDWPAIGRAWLAGMRAQFDLISGAISGFAGTIQEAIMSWFEVDLTGIGARWGNQLLAGLQSVAGEIRAWVNSLIPDTVDQAIQRNNAAAAGAAVGGMVGPPSGGATGGEPGSAAPPADISGPRSSVEDTGRKFAALQPPVRLDGTVTVRVQVDGAGKVSGVSSDNANVKVAASSTGRMVGTV